MDLRQRIEAVYDEMVSWRRRFHEYPELSFEEKETSAFIHAKLVEFGLDRVDYVCGTGVVALLQGGAGPGPCLGLRADIDALPITEQTGYPYASKHEGIMHACGHDAHAAMLLAAAKILSELRGRLKGSVKFIFQPGEEKYPGGASLLYQAGVMEQPRVDLILGAHIVPHKKSGVVLVNRGPVCIGCDLADVEVSGKSGHASGPHLTRDALLAACQFVTAVQQIVSRNSNPRETAVVSIGTLHSGTASNIVADKASLGISTRYYTLETKDLIKRRLYEIAEGLEKVTECSFRIKYHDGSGPVVNTEDAFRLVYDSCRKYFGEESVEVGNVDLGSDDFAVYLNEGGAPGAYFFVLAGYEGEELLLHHHPRFTWNESAMLAGVRAFVASAVEYLK